MGVCNRCGKECDTIQYPTVQHPYGRSENNRVLDWCEDCLIDFLWIADYVPPIFKCWNCDNDCPINHYIDEDDNHFCSKKCAVDYYTGLLHDWNII